ncbi:hypothetical protein D2A34_23020 [Clostridium chromiireducens]|uniref:Glycosyltransferase family 8 protein n=1 Tax=Clostridium chromiireducens TaxID=225345 RepID=A0A399IHS2_9CLOT|nr:glycosyltransferase [Clostridium chromiireducens]RII32543.1 hypothetical protein D2A34_23020 [Clostridium chromiireducens]
MKAYITTLSTDNYVTGVINLKKTLMAVNSKYPLFVYVDRFLKKETFDKLQQYNIEYIIQKNKIELPNNILESNTKNGVSHWTNTFIKLDLFKLIEFEKLVYLDSDMMIFENIDELFDKPHISAVVAGKEYKGNEQWEEFNSGLMVIEPKKDALIGIEKHIEKVSKEKASFGDQDILNSFYSDWKYKYNLHLNPQYNMFAIYTDYYVKKLGFKLSNKNINNKKGNLIKVVHFTGRDKPWMLSKKTILRKLCSLLIHHRNTELKIYLKYFRLYTD